MIQSKQFMAFVLVLTLGVSMLTACSKTNTVTITNNKTITTTSTVTAPPTTYASTPIPTTTAASTNYVNGGLLVSVSWLNSRLDNSGLIVIDARTAALYTTSHIKNAINIPTAFVDETDLLVTGDTSLLKSDVDLSNLLGESGVSNTATIVVYGANVDTNAGRVFWALDYLGAKDVHVLDGGFGKWTSSGFAVTTEKTVKPATIFNYLADGNLYGRKAHVLAGLGKSNIVLVDSRNATDFVVKRIPGAVNILTGDFLNADGTVKSFSDLTAFLTTKGITPGKTVIAYCYVGYRSAQEYFVLRLMGYTVTNYDGSTTEWFADTKLPTTSG